MGSLSIPHYPIVHSAIRWVDRTTARVKVFQKDGISVKPFNSPYR
ncbi:hypothetical protein [Leptolinea tardivitalis]|nr:hypothetical protein [Leptolinea tardivitalis]